VNECKIYDQQKKQGSVGTFFQIPFEHTIYKIFRWPKIREKLQYVQT